MDLNLNNLKTLVSHLIESPSITPGIKKALSEHLSYFVETRKPKGRAETIKDALKLERLRGVVDEYSHRIVAEAIDR